MIFKCYLCNNYKFWNKKCYEIIATSNSGEQDLFKKKICEPCGDQVNRVYEDNKKFLEEVDYREDD